MEQKEKYSSHSLNQSSSVFQKQVHIFFDEIHTIQENEKKIQKKLSHSLFIYGIILTITGGLAFLSSLGILSGDSGTIGTFGIIMSTLAFLNYKHIFQSDGLQKIKEKIFSFFGNIKNLFSKKRSRKKQGLYSELNQTKDDSLEKMISFYSKRPRPRIFGVCALLSELTGTEVSIIRALFILGLFISGGWIIIGYIILQP